MNKTPTPFFMRFVEKQAAPVDTDVKAGASDKKTNVWRDSVVEVTMKYPSDNDDEPIYTWP